MKCLLPLSDSLLEKIPSHRRLDLDDNVKWLLGNFMSKLTPDEQGEVWDLHLARFPRRSAQRPIRKLS